MSISRSNGRLRRKTTGIPKTGVRVVLRSRACWRSILAAGKKASVETRKSYKIWNVTAVTSTSIGAHCGHLLDFGQLAPIVEDGTMLCAGLAPRLYESLKALCCLASADGPLQAHQVAEAAEMPPAQTAKILQLMTWAGFIESRRGTKGGFWLVIPADEIRVTDVADFFVRHTKRRAGKEPDGLLKALEATTVRCQKEFSRITVAGLAKASGCEPGRPAAQTVAKQRQRKAS